MIEIAKNADGVRFCLLEHPFELDKLGIGEFIYFKKYLGMSDYMANFKSWLKRPTVYLVVAVLNNSIVGWSMNESWSKPSSDGRPVFVLRAIEISPQFSSRGLGRTLFTLIARILPGHIITKPVNANAKKFFGSLSFSQPAKDCPIGLADHPGYLVLDEDTKSGLSLDRVDVVQDRTELCRMKVFPRDTNARIESRPSLISNALDGSMSKMQGVQVSGSKAIEGKGNCGMGEGCDRNGISSGAGTSSSLQEDERGKFIGNQKMLSCCECGENMAGKFVHGGQRSGTSFICTSCGKERYFLPLRKAA